MEYYITQSDTRQDCECTSMMDGDMEYQAYMMSEEIDKDLTDYIHLAMIDQSKVKPNEYTERLHPRKDYQRQAYWLRIR